MTIFDTDGEFVDAVKVRPSEDEAPYVAALAEKGWIFVGDNPADEDWPVVKGKEG